MAKKPQVICPVCGKKFYREETEFVLLNKRYYHRNCYDEKMGEEAEREEIHQRCKQLFGDGYSKTKINRQINNMIKDGKTIKNINKALFYWYDIRKENSDKANNGINIVNWIYSEALEYFMRQDALKEKEKQVVTASYEVEQYKIKQKPIKKPLKVKFFDIH